MAITYTWGSWEETWQNGRFSCLFVESYPDPDGMIHATGLYHAANGEMFNDIDTFQDRISDRTAIVGDSRGGVLVRKEFAELLATMPLFLQEVSERFEDILSGVASAGDYCSTAPAPQSIET